MSIVLKLVIKYILNINNSFITKGCIYAVKLNRHLSIIKKHSLQKEKCDNTVL